MSQIGAIRFENNKVSGKLIQNPVNQIRSILELHRQRSGDSEMLQQTEAVGFGQECPARLTRALEQRPHLFDYHSLTTVVPRTSPGAYPGPHPAT